MADREALVKALKHGMTRREALIWLTAGHLFTEAGTVVAATPKSGGILRLANNIHDPDGQMDSALFTSGVDYARGRTTWGLFTLNIDVVNYFENGSTRRGELKFSYRWLGVEWHFVNQQHRQLFAGNPKKYTPQYGGHCANGLSGGRVVGARPRNWRIIEGGCIFSFPNGAVCSGLRMSMVNVSWLVNCGLRSNKVRWSNLEFRRCCRLIGVIFTPCAGIYPGHARLLRSNQWGIAHCPERTLPSG